MFRRKSITGRVVDAARKRGVKVYTRKQWGSVHEDVYAWRRKNKPHSLLPSKPVDTVWQHITVTRRSGSFAADCQLVERIGFARFQTGCSYNFMVDMTTGEVGVGQPLDAKGAHTLNDKNLPGFSHDQNAVSIAIAVIGMPDYVLQPAAFNAISQLIAACIEVGAVTKGFDYMPHSAVAATHCPCDSTRDLMPKIRHRALVT